MTAIDLSQYKPVSGEKPVLSSKFRGLIQDVQDRMNDQPIDGLDSYPASASLFLSGTGRWVSPGGIVFSAAKYADTAVATTAKTDLFGGSFSITGGTVGPTSAIRVWGGGEITNTTGSKTAAFELVLGSTVIWAATATLSASADPRGWYLRATIQAAGSGSQRTGGKLVIGAAGAVATGVGSIQLTTAASDQDLAPFYGATSVALSSTQTLKLNVTTQTATTETVTCHWARVEVTS